VKTFHGRQGVTRLRQCMLTAACLSCPVSDVGVLWPNGWMDQDETWHAGRPQPWPHYATWGPSSPQKRGLSAPIFGPCLLWPNGWIDKDATRYSGSPRPRRHCVTWGLSCPQNGAQQPLRSFLPMSLVSDWSPISATAKCLSV